MQHLSSRGFDLRKIWLGQGHVSWPTILRIFRVFEIGRFEAIFRVVDRGNRSHQLLGAFERLGGSSGAQSPPDFSTFLVRMVVVFFGGFSRFGICRQ